MTDTHILNETSGETLARLGTDGAQWAAAFSGVASRLYGAYRLGDAVNSTPGGLLHTWFANAIQAGKSAGYGAARAEIDELQGKLDGANATWQRAQRKLDAIRALAANYATLPSDEYIGAAYDLRKILDSDD